MTSFHSSISFGINSGAEHNTVGRFTQKMGFEKVGENFVRTLGAAHVAPP